MLNMRSFHDDFGESLRLGVANEQIQEKVGENVNALQLGSEFVDSHHVAPLVIIICPATEPPAAERVQQILGICYVHIVADGNEK